MLYPIFLELEGRRVLVVGGGAVAERKVQTLLAAGAVVTVVATDVTERLRQMGASGTIRLVRREFQEGDLDSMLLAVSATGDAEVQEQIAAAARSRGIPVNTVDRPGLCDFVVPAIVRRGDVVVAISTSGKSPALAAALRAKLEDVVTDDVARAARVLGEIRNEVHSRFADADERKEVFEAIVASGIIDWIRGCDDAAALLRIRAIVEKFT